MYRECAREKPEGSLCVVFINNTFISSVRGEAMGREKLLSRRLVSRKEIFHNRCASLTFSYTVFFYITVSRRIVIFIE